MENHRTLYFLLGSYWTGWRVVAVWVLSVGTLCVLGMLRVATDAEFAFASLALLPVLVTAWTGGQRSGFVMALLAAGMWVLSDFFLERQFSAGWIPWANAGARVLTYSLMALLAAQVRRQFDREHDFASADALTGLNNRRMFLEAGALEVERSKRHAHSLAVIFLDLDDFKRLNDTRGHASGDAALLATADALRNSLRMGDRVARLGGDEFAILLPEIHYADAAETGSKVFDAVNQALRHFPPVHASVGVAWFGEIDRDFSAMLEAADALMYEVKQSGKAAWRSRRCTGTDGSDL